MARKSNVTGTSPSPIQMQTLTEWGGFVRGDMVTAKGRKGQWKFLYHAQAPSGNTWVTLYRPDFGFLAKAEGDIKHPPKKKAGKRK